MERSMSGIRSQALVLALLCALLTVTRAEAKARSWAQPQIERVVADGLMAPSVATFRPNDPLLRTELAQLLPALAPTDEPTTTTTSTDTTVTDTTPTDTTITTTIETPSPEAIPAAN